MTVVCDSLTGWRIRVLTEIEVGKTAEIGLRDGKVDRRLVTFIARLRQAHPGSLVCNIIVNKRRIQA